MNYDGPEKENLHTNRQERIQRAEQDPQYFRGLMATKIEWLEENHKECKKERKLAEDTVWSKLDPLRSDVDKARGAIWILGGLGGLITIVIAVLLFLRGI